MRMASGIRMPIHLIWSLKLLYVCYCRKDKATLQILFYFIRLYISPTEAVPSSNNRPYLDCHGTAFTTARSFHFKTRCSMKPFADTVTSLISSGEANKYVYSKAHAPLRNSMATWGVNFVTSVHVTSVLLVHIVQMRITFLPVPYVNTWRLRHLNYDFACCFVST
jgi:hypothetical protein